MADCVGPGRGALVKNTSTNSTTPSSRTAFKKQVTDLINKFDEKVAAKMSAETSNSPSSEENAASEKTSTTPTLEETSMNVSTTEVDVNPTPEENKTMKSDDVKTDCSNPTPAESVKMTSNGSSPTLPPLRKPTATAAAATGGQAEVTKSSSSSDVIPETVEESLGREIMNWATAADRRNLEQDYKITVWFRKNSSVPTVALNPAEKGKLIFKRIGVPRGRCIVCDDSRRDRLVLTIQGSVPVSSLNLSQTFEAKPGLWTRPVAPVVKEKMIYIYWTSDETEYRDLEETLGLFGVITSGIENQVYRAKPGATEEEKMMDGV